MGVDLADGRLIWSGAQGGLESQLLDVLRLPGSLQQLGVALGRAAVVQQAEALRTGEYVGGRHC